MDGIRSTSARTAVKVWESGFNPLRSDLIPGLLLRLAAGVAILVAIGTLISWPTVVELVRKIRPSYAALAVALLLPNLFLQHIKWLRLLRLIQADTGQLEAARSLLVGFALGLVTPGRLGEIGRAVSLPRHGRIQATLLAAVDKANNLGVILLGGFVSIAVLLVVRGGSPPGWVAAAVGTVLGSVFLLVSLLPDRIGSLVARRPFRALRKWAPEAAPWTKSNPGFRLQILALSAIFHATFVLQFSLLVAAFTGELSFAYPFAAATALSAKTLVPISFGDLGTREGSAALVFSGIGVLPAAAFNAALLLFLINVVLPALFGILLLVGVGAKEARESR